MLPGAGILRAIGRAARIAVGSARSFWPDDALHARGLIME